MVDGRLQYGKPLFKEGVVFLNGDERRRTLSSKCDIYRVEYSAFSFVPKNLDRCCSERRILIVNGYHIYITTVVCIKCSTMEYD